MASELQPVHGAVAEFCRSKELILRRKERNRETTEGLLLRSRELKASLLRDMEGAGVALVDVTADDGTRWYVRTELSGALPMTQSNLLKSFVSMTDADVGGQRAATSIEAQVVKAAKAAWKQHAKAFKLSKGDRRVVLSRSRTRHAEPAPATASLAQLAAAFVRCETEVKRERAAVRRDIAMPTSVCQETEARVAQSVRETNPESLVQHVHMRSRNAETIYTMQCCEKRVRARLTLKTYLHLVCEACRESGVASEPSFSHARDMPRVGAALERALHRFAHTEPAPTQCVKFHVARK